MQLNHIGNASIPSSSGKTISVIDPSCGEMFDDIQRGNANDIDAAVRSARDCLSLVWSQLSAAERGRLLLRLSNSVAEHADELAHLVQRESGRPARQARADVLALGRSLAFYAGAADKLHGDTLASLDGYSTMTWREPHGVTGHILAWNDALRLFGRSVGAALAAGNVCVVKPAENACLSMLRVAQLAAETGFPAGALNIVTGYGLEAGDALARHPGIDHLSFSGSPRVATLVQQAAAEHHCPVTLVLGGKSSHIVFADADLETALPAIVSAIVQNAGQSRGAASRLLVAQPIYDLVLQQLGEMFEALRVGPAAMDLDVGPLIRQRQQQHVWDFLSDAHADGIAMVAQGQIVDEAPEGGFYQAPTLLCDVPAGHRLMHEEIFGPVLCAMSFDDEAHALALINTAPFGPTTGIWSRDGALQLRLARRIKSGQVFINHYPADGEPGSEPGGAGALQALHDFTTLKTVAVRHG
ncbi:MAG: aldehyde dehydrogenase family protein [Polaromonas sp.]